MSTKTYSELIRLPTFSERFQYATLSGVVGKETFSGRRLINQSFYQSSEWKRVRDSVIARDFGCDLACPERTIIGKIIVHHLNPVTLRDLDDMRVVLDPELLVCVSFNTHNLIHYGDVNDRSDPYIPRSQNDTSPWR